VFENCSDLDIDGLQEIICVHEKCCKEILPILLRFGADLNCEIYGVRIAHIVFRDAQRGGNIELLKLTFKVGKHFHITENVVDSEESLLLRNNIGAKSPQELGLDSNSHEGRGLYLRHIVECACALLDTGECKPFRILRSTNQEEFILKQISEIPELRPIATTYKLQLMRTHYRNDTAERIFQEEQQWIPRDFKYSCGCTLVHDACYFQNLPLLEALHQNGFDLNSTNKKGQTPLHASCYKWNKSGKCMEYLLKRFLGQFYVPRDAKREEIVARTPDE
jgi:ankyrin repeat protein